MHVFFVYVGMFVCGFQLFIVCWFDYWLLWDYVRAPFICTCSSVGLRIAHDKERHRLYTYAHTHTHIYIYIDIHTDIYTYTYTHIRHSTHARQGVSIDKDSVAISLTCTCYGLDNNKYERCATRLSNLGFGERHV